MSSEQGGYEPRSFLDETIQSILNDRGRLDFMTVARAMVLQAHLKGAKHSRLLGEQLGISRQTRHNWLKPQAVEEWQKQWADRFSAAYGGRCSPVKAKRTLSDSDWRWIAGVLATTGARTWGLKKAAIEREAARVGSEMPHLRGIHRVTLFRNRVRLTVLGEELRKGLKLQSKPN
jgi:hypothetical protein